MFFEISSDLPASITLPCTSSPSICSSRLFAAFLLSLLTTPSFAQSEPSNSVERYTVTATRPYYDEALSRIFPQYEFDKSSLVSPLHANDVLLQSPSVSINGQGGQIQSISVRGYSRWRIQTLLDGVPIVSDRRAGSSVGFIPPDFISSATVLPGAASTYLGSGAIGGAVNLQLESLQEPYLKVGYSSNQQMKAVSYAGTSAADSSKNGANGTEKSGVTDWNISYRSANNGEDANGNTLFDQFDQTGLFLKHRPENSIIKEAWTLYSNNKDIGKSSSDYPESRRTTYPNNTHWLGKIAFEDNLFAGNIWWHKSTLDTSVFRPESRINDSENKAFDYGFNINTDTQLKGWDLNWQLQLSGREGVVADEREFTLTPSDLLVGSSESDLAYEVRTLDASEINTAAIVDASRQWQSFSVAIGTRVDWQRQSDDSGGSATQPSDVQPNNAQTNNGQPSRSQSTTNFSGYLGANYQLSPHWSASLYVSSAFRNPSLTERFFAGETPRGTVLGSTQLETEQALNKQLTVAYSARHIQGSIEVFHQQIDNYIERITVAEDVLQYANLGSATIEGASYQVSWQSQDSIVDARLSGMWISGEDNLGNTIADIPANNQRLDVGVNWQDTRLFTVLSYRASKTDVADGERALSDVFTLDIGANWQLGDDMQLQASWSNLTNQHYYTSADDKAAFAQGESVQLAITYQL
ncbi:TonB-dependent receptor [Alteromonas sp. PRIM-21]|uniref:TonB-dependent receptor n=1 Tax=Alteromonas sp. PRIM-21 TaxID=1454978 RepID=UPI0022B97958|nr:TonB-dependent receptor [Alteromonas sp. PRIM-21]MCZ8529096.1 TonB-dependent receptor [Alteromonas sp. PRIM-21]